MCGVSTTFGRSSSSRGTFGSCAKTSRPARMRPETSSVTSACSSTISPRAVLTLAPSAAAYRLEGGRWPATTITYYNEVPAYQWAVDTAAYAWNSSGAHVRFLKTSRRDADVLVGVRWFK